MDLWQKEEEPFSVGRHLGFTNKNVAYSKAIFCSLLLFAHSNDIKQAKTQAQNKKFMIEFPRKKNQL